MVPRVPRPKHLRPPLTVRPAIHGVFLIPAASARKIRLQHPSVRLATLGHLPTHVVNRHRRSLLLQYVLHPIHGQSPTLDVSDLNHSQLLRVVLLVIRGMGQHVLSRKPWPLHQTAPLATPGTAVHVPNLKVLQRPEAAPTDIAGMVQPALKQKVLQRPEAALPDTAGMVQPALKQKVLQRPEAAPLDTAGMVQPARKQKVLQRPEAVPPDTAGMVQPARKQKVLRRPGAAPPDTAGMDRPVRYPRVHLPQSLVPAPLAEHCQVQHVHKQLQRR